MKAHPLYLPTSAALLSPSSHSHSQSSASTPPSRPSARTRTSNKTPPGSTSRARPTTSGPPKHHNTDVFPSHLVPSRPVPQGPLQDVRPPTHPPTHVNRHVSRHGLHLRHNNKQQINALVYTGTASRWLRASVLTRQVYKRSSVFIQGGPMQESRHMTLHKYNM